MPYTIHTDVCEGIADCIPGCPVECISLVDSENDRNAKGTRWAWIDQDTCIECGACYNSCPIEGAISDHVVEGAQRKPK